ncbi:hypothetical protein [Sulfitobacter geojensis]|uniref:hypothetical protein n=2 Tax=Alphaproteobacteria TaxID=28211 RepID=UPI00046A5293|nr:hypothetical protein [Sulfitobacter geojensis]NYI27477.1 hypothetical protein [Sulfitobacter geojensis]
MTTARQMAANRANALASSGPKTIEGKVTIGHNARKHGATSQLDPERVGLWARIIMDQAEISLQVAMDEGDGIGLAWALARAEVRFNTIAEILKAEKIYLVALTNNEKVKAFSASMAERRDRYLLGQATAEEIKTFQNRPTLTEFWEKIEENREIERRHRLMRRYYREARSARRKAFQDWIDWLRIAPPTSRGEGFNRRDTKKRRFTETNPISIYN